MVENDEDGLSEARRKRRRKRRLITTLVVVLVLLVLAIGPPLINANRLAHRISTSMSESLGRPVHMDHVSLHLLPVPGFTMDNLVVSEDPAFGYEPVIRANRVEASIRVSSLWRRQVEFSSVRFVTDPNGSAPSMNLVRRADGRWNLESILLHAASENTAPTAQSKAGPAPRFPYIEATGARLNIKMGDEKEPFALTDADLALWLPSPQQWRVRLEGKPTRTDTSVSDTGILNLEATLAKADKLADVPIELTAEWKRAPLGQASLIVSGSDLGWRGDFDATGNAHGTLGNAVLRTTLKLKNVRRRDFIPARLLSLSVECRGVLAITNSVVLEPSCTLPTGATDDDTAGKGVIAATADSLYLTTRRADNARVGMTEVPEDWLLDWSRLFTQRIPAETSWPGTVSGSITNAPADNVGATSSASTAGWSGSFQTSAAQAGDASADAAHAEHPRVWTLTAETEGFVLSPVDLAAAMKPPLLLTGSFTGEQYRFQLSGTATHAELSTLAAQLPPFSDGVENLTAADPKTSDTAVRVNILCSRAWGGPQTCVNVQATEAAPVPSRKRRNR